MNWPMVDLRDIANIHYGKALKKEDRDDSGQVKVYGSSGEVGTHSESLADYPTLVIGRKGSVGEVVWAPEGGWVIDTAYFVEIKNHEKVDLKYLFYMLKKSDLAKRTITTSIPGLNRDDLYETAVFLPPVSEQKRIAAILDKADAIRRKRQQAIQLADEFLRAVFLDRFGDPVTNPKGWPIVELRELIDPLDKLNYGVVQPGEDDADGVPLVRSGDLSDTCPPVETLRRVSQAIDHKHRNSRLKGNEILIACVGTIGRVGWVTQEMKGWNIARAVTRIPVRDGVNREYLYRYLQNPVVQGYFERETRAVAQPTLNVGLIAKTPIALPPIEMQEEFLNQHKNVMYLKDRQLCGESLGKELFDAIASNVLHGK